MANLDSEIADLTNAGTNLLNAGNTKEARNIFTRICEQDDKNYNAHLALGVINGMLGNSSDAIYHLERAIEIDPDQPGAYFNLGIALKEKGALNEAAACYLKAISYAPHNAACHNNLGNVFLDLRNFDKAIQCFEKALALSPDSAEYYYNLGNALKGKGLRTEACKALNNAIRLRPDFLPALKYLGTVYISLGNLENAERVFLKIISQNPGDQDAISGMASIMICKQQYGKALDILEPFLNKPSVSPAIALAFSRMCKRTGNKSDAIKLLEKVLAGDEYLTNDSKAQIHFNLGYFYDIDEEYKLAFDHFRMGNELRVPSSDSDDHKKLTDLIISTFNKEFLRRTVHSDNASELPIFIVGMPRSGTSLVEQIVASHPDVYGAGEADTLPSLLNTIPGRVGSDHTYPDAIYRLDRTMLNDISQKYIDLMVAHDSTALRITDKMPGNYLNLGFIELLFPMARIIHCKRNPLDTCLSCYFQDFYGQQYATRLETLGQYYQQYHRIMQYWNEVMKIRILEVNYEDLVNNFESSCKEIIEYCGLDWDESCLDFHKQDRLVLTSSMDQVNKPIYKKSIDRWKNYGKFIGGLKSSLPKGLLNRISEG